MKSRRDEVSLFIWQTKASSNTLPGETTQEEVTAKKTRTSRRLKDFFFLCLLIVIFESLVLEDRISSFRGNKAMFCVWPLIEKDTYRTVSLTELLTIYSSCIFLCYNKRTSGYMKPEVTVLRSLSLMSSFKSFSWMYSHSVSSVQRILCQDLGFQMRSRENVSNKTLVKVYIL